MNNTKSKKRRDKRKKKKGKKNQSHLTAEQRSSIESGLSCGSPLREIAASVDKDPTTVSKEIRKHRTLKHRTDPYGKPRNPCSKVRDCDLSGICAEKCTHSFPLCRNCPECSGSCPEFEPDICSRLLRYPHVCNGCEKLPGCRKNIRYIYSAASAQKAYESELSESRKGINMEEESLKKLDELVSPLIAEKRQPVSHVFASHADEIDISQSTFYRYVDSGILAVRNIDLPKKVKYKPRKRKQDPHPSGSEKREGRAYEDYLKHITAHPVFHVIQMDTVIGRPGGKTILTLHNTLDELQAYILLPSKEARHVSAAFDALRLRFGSDELFLEYFGIILTDNGTEFADVKHFEDLGIRIFFCDPNRSDQKGSCEKNHEYLRKYLPKGTSFDALEQNDIDLISSHINSTIRPSLNNATPYEMTLNRWGPQVTQALGIGEIAPDDVLGDRTLLKNIIPSGRYEKFRKDNTKAE